MSERGYDRGNMFPHDGEHGRSCTGFGCDCDEQNYGSRGGRRNSPNLESAGKFWVFYIIAILVGTIINGKLFGPEELPIHWMLLNSLHTCCL